MSDINNKLISDESYEPIFFRKNYFSSDNLQNSVDFLTNKTKSSILQENRYEKNRKEIYKFSICDFLEEITNQNYWFDKIFDDYVITVWLSEIPTASIPIFELAIKLLRVTAQGYTLRTDKYIIHNNSEIIYHELYNWDDTSAMCNNCHKKFKQDVINNPQKFKLIYNLNFFDDLHEYNQVLKCNYPCIPPHFTLDDYIKYYPQGIIDKNFHLECKSVISNIILRDTKFLQSSIYYDIKGIFSYNHGLILKKPVDQSINEVNEINEAILYSSTGNNITINIDKYQLFMPLIGRIFEYFIPVIEQVIHKSLNKTSLRAIVKIENLVLNNSNPNYYGSTWHDANLGSPFINPSFIKFNDKHVAAICIHYININNITDSFMEFRKQNINNNNFKEKNKGGKYLGLVSCHEGASVVFPKTLQYRIKKFDLVATPSVYTTLTLYFINPDQ